MACICYPFLLYQRTPYNGIPSRGYPLAQIRPYRVDNYDCALVWLSYWSSEAGAQRGHARTSQLWLAGCINCLLASSNRPAHFTLPASFGAFIFYKQANRIQSDYNLYFRVKTHFFNLYFWVKTHLFSIKTYGQIFDFDEVRVRGRKNPFSSYY